MVRTVKKSDFDRIYALGTSYNPQFKELYNLSDVFDEEFSKVFIFEENGQIKAFLHIVELYETVDIQNIVVDDAYRKNGIATYLLDYMLGSISEQIKIITLEVAVNNDAAMNLYQNFGFEIINTRKSYYNGVNAYLMVKQVK